ncbi:CDP-glycerol glycerophosphotransferase family protein [Methanobrevibacter arboriphilus]|uniref:Uncharacterized protein n=2 Tax=Methanobrevibacter arboriphilus TaxID=39441 RepID=A0ACA8R3L6_METAZ|nr:CDP-glycerol glycerophosphotransferase family protein [Methanobrevibacter arboriphilus]BBL62202.1 hypothetical protein MarbSA_12420 [Methanobrevibacter arboriphilus]
MNFLKKILLGNSYTKKAKYKYNTLSKKLDYITIQNNLTTIRNKKKINVIFIFYFRTSGMDSLIDLLNKDESFNVTVLLVPFKTISYNVYKNDRLHDSQLEEYNDNYNYFKSKGFNTIKAYDESTNSLIDIELELMPDIIFYMSPWEGILPPEYRMHNLPQNIIYCYIPYSMYLSKLKNDQFNRPLQKKAWKIFAQTPLHKQLAIKYSNNKGSNVLVTGYPKMDPLIKNTEGNMPKIWKSEGSEKIRIIWAPHYSIGKDENVKLAFSTFEYNYKFFYEYAKKHPEIEWIFKPHPKLIYAGERMPDNENFKLENLKEYYKKWDELPNATVYERGDYLNVFKNSDAMITDSISFLAEYLYAKHPGLLLTRPEQEFNEFGEIIKEGWYKSDGKDLDGIEKFINDVLIEGKDNLKNERDNIYFAYLNKNGVSASQNIYKYLKKTLVD